MLKKVLRVTFVVLFLATFIGPAISTGGEDGDEPAYSTGWMCDQCNAGDLWWCAGCLGLTQQEYNNLFL